MNIRAAFPFIMILGASTGLLIFLGAWAIASQIDPQRLQASGISGDAPQTGTFNLSQPSQGESSLGQGKRRTDADTWWGKAALAVCPLH